MTAEAALLVPPSVRPPAPARRGALLAFAGSLLVAGCGQRGPLYLPENAPPPRRTRRPAAQPAPEDPRR